MNNFDLDSQELTKENVEQFLNVMREMKIKYIEMFHEEPSKEFEIKVKDFGT